MLCICDDMYPSLLSRGRLGLYIKRFIHVRETRAEGIATLAEQLASRAKRNIKEFPSLDLDPSLDDQMDRQTERKKRERERDRSPDVRPKDHDDGSTCSIQDAVLLLGPLHPRNLASPNPTSL